jgi:TolB-like protein/Tfp pilus assembly protein PilF
MGEPSAVTPLTEKLPEGRLDSWKEIAAYLGRDVTTVQRWEKREGMPVHRHVHDRRGSVYALRTELDVWREGRKERLEAEDSPAAGATTTKELPQREGKGRPRLPLALVLSGSAVVLLLVAAYVAITKNRAPGAEQPRIRSLAVLPLKNMSGDAGQDYLADGLTEAIIGRLAQIRDLRVVSRTSVMHFKDTKLSVPEIAKALQVDAVVEGSVIRDGNRIRVYAQLIRGAADAHLWSESYDRQMEDVLELEGDLAQTIAAKVAASVTGEEQERLAAARPVAPEVYESYLKGEYAFNRSKTRDDIESSVPYFEGAIRRDPNFAPAYAGLAAVYSELGTVFAGAPPGEMRAKVVDAAQKALALDPGQSEAHVLLAQVKQQQWHWSEAKAEYARALELRPNDAAAHVGMANWLLCQGRTTEALQWAERGRELDPLAVSGTGIGWILFQSHHYEASLRELRSTIAAQPDNVGAQWFLGFTLIANYQANEAIRVLEKVAATTNRSPAVLGVLIHAYAQAGRRNDALRLLAELHKRRSKGYVPAGAFVNAYVGLDERDQAFFWMEQAFKEQSNILQFLKVHPYFDPLRKDPRFADLVHRVGLDREY